MTASITRRLRTAAGALAAASALTFTAQAPAQAAPVQGSSPRTAVVEIMNGVDHQCLEVADARTDDGAPVRVWTCTGGDEQRWIWNGHQLINVHSGKCLDMPAFSTTPGTQADQWTCDGGTNQDWNLRYFMEMDDFTMINVSSGLMLWTAECTTENGAPVLQSEPESSPCSQYIWYSKTISWIPDGLPAGQPLAQ
ncbi:RICIN domain-containing protein [Streptomyces sp. FH025]|uniref:RICIN domain-containing protein n=1 Tax=Streptomyces sp. FH025 TaxID=2815937 RepID=UPI001A9F7007|nr:RICIN domain-containing protein [Streptomyces sp. FH025]MBO1413252.1 RICIN domain-containing protein [Streptomyces sp. FH025]